MNQLIALILKLLFAAILITTLLYLITKLLSPYARNKSSYVAASLDKEHQLMSVKSPRIVLVGGSNLALGINCQSLSKNIHSPVVNMGLHAGLGLDFILNESLMGIRSGDTVILSIEHYLGSGNKKLMAQLADVNPKAIALMNLSLSDRVRILVSQLQLCISGTFYKAIKRDKDPIYYREAFNSFGDLTTHYGQAKPSSIGGDIKFSNTDYTDGIAAINNFIDSAREKGALVYFVFPVFPESSYRKNLNSLSRLYAEYKNSLKCPILGNIRSSVIEDRYFYDTVYHLDSSGIQKRTQIMLNLLKKEMRGLKK